MTESVSEKTKALMAASAHERWLMMSEEERAQMAVAIAKSMRQVHATRSREERVAIAKKAAATRKANRMKGKAK